MIMDNARKILFLNDLGLEDNGPYIKVQPTQLSDPHWPGLNTRGTIWL